MITFIDRTIEGRVIDDFLLGVLSTFLDRDDDFFGFSVIVTNGALRHVPVRGPCNVDFILVDKIKDKL